MESIQLGCWAEPYCAAALTESQPSSRTVLLSHLESTSFPYVEQVHSSLAPSHLSIPLVIGQPLTESTRTLPLGGKEMKSNNFMCEKVVQTEPTDLLYQSSSISFGQRLITFRDRHSVPTQAPAFGFSSR